MNIDDKFQAVIISVCLSFLLSRVAHYLDEKNKNNDGNRKFKHNIYIISSILQPAIINTKPTDYIDTIMNQLMADNYLIVSNKELHTDFKEICTIYTLLKEGNYEGFPAKKEKDLATICGIRDKYKKFNS